MAAMRKERNNDKSLPPENDKIAPSNISDDFYPGTNRGIEEANNNNGIPELASRRFPHRVPGQHFVKGIMYNKFTSEELLVDMFPKFEVRSDDVLVTGYPKSGTTWLEEIVFLVMNGGDLSVANSMPVYLRVPYLEDGRMFAMLASMASPRVYKSHLHYSSLPPQVHKKQPRIIHMLRNPKDLAVSFFHFYRALDELGSYTGDWAQFLAMFMDGHVVQGSWFENTADWWRRRQLPNVLVVFYEDLKRDPRAAVDQIAAFCGASLDGHAVDNILSHTSFKNMEANPMTNFTLCKNINCSISPFLRKGQVGDWRNYFTIAQNECFDKLYKEKMSELEGLSFEYQGSVEKF